MTKLNNDGWSIPTLLEVNAFLIASNGLYQFHNLADIGGDDYRLMYREQIGLDAKGNPITKMQCKINPIKNYLS